MSYAIQLNSKEVLNRDILKMQVLLSCFYGYFI